MVRIKILKNDRCLFPEVDAELVTEGLKFQKERESIYLILPDKKIRLTKNAVRIREWTIQLAPKPDSWELIPLCQKMTFGRDLACTISLQDPTISKIHFVLCHDHLEDPGSTNGTYVNGRRERDCRLKPGDHIVFGNQELYWFDEVLVTGFSWKGMIPRISTFSKPDIPQLSAIPASYPEWNGVEAELESPQTLAPLKKTKWFQAVGSSFLILISGLCSAAVIWLWMPEQKSSMSMLLLNSVSMCLAFAGYGLWNRHMTFKDQQEEIKKQETKYLRYLEDFQAQILVQKQNIQQIIAQQVRFYDLKLSNFHNQAACGFELWIGYRNVSWLKVQYRKPNYLQADEPLYQKQAKLIEILLTPIKGLYLLRQQDRVCIHPLSQELVESLFLQWVLRGYRTGRKWIWIDSQMDPHHPFLMHPGCQIRGRLSLVRNQQEWEALQQELDPDDEFVFLIRESFVDVNKLPQALCITDVVTDPQKVLYPGQLSWSRSSMELYRQICLLQNQEESSQSILSLFQKPKKGGRRPELKVVLGMSRDHQNVYLDLSESQHGPHGFIAGMTGSGKSELLTNLLLQLVSLNTPDELQYLLIDFKGGAFGQAFYEFSHCKGYLTNLETEEATRFGISLQAFLKERQRKLQTFAKEHPGMKVHIDAYNEVLFEHPMAHVLVVIDEMAQLKMILPDFMSQLKEIARIGRSLGIHCLMSTQKPMGVIDDQIWANTGFRICLQVGSKMDSYEVLHHEQAQNLKLPGEFILQVQNESKEWQGRSFYLQEKTARFIDGYREVDESGKTIGGYHQEQWSLFEQIASSIPKSNSKSDWIVCPFDQNAFEKQEIALIDHCESCSMSAWAPKPQTITVVYSSFFSETEAWLQNICGWIKEPVYGIEPMSFSFCDEVLSMHQVCRIDSFQSPSLWLIPGNRLTLDQLQVLQDPKCTWIVLLDTWDQKAKSWLSLAHQRICISYRSIDEIREFFGCYVAANVSCTHEKGLIFEKNQLHKILFHHFEGKISKTSDPSFLFKAIQDDFYLGFDPIRQKDVFWSKQRKLVFAYVQPSIQDVLEKEYISKLKQMDLVIQKNALIQADVYLFDLLAHDLDTQCPEFLSLIYDADIVWMGKGLREHVYLLKRTLPLEMPTECIAWIRDEVFCLEGKENEHE